MKTGIKIESGSAPCRWLEADPLRGSSGSTRKYLVRPAREPAMIDVARLAGVSHQTVPDAHRGSLRRGRAGSTRYRGRHGTVPCRDRRSAPGARSLTMHVPHASGRLTHGGELPVGLLEAARSSNRLRPRRPGLACPSGMAACSMRPKTGSPEILTVSSPTTSATAPLVGSPPGEGPVAHVAEPRHRLLDLVFRLRPYPGRAGQRRLESFRRVSAVVLARTERSNELSPGHPG